MVLKGFKVVPNGLKWLQVVQKRQVHASPSQASRKAVVAAVMLRSGTPPPPSPLVATPFAPASHILAVPPVQVCGDLSEEEDGRVVGRVLQG